ncbi:hypothetical protein JW964_24495 [candidate division KSB1 bacterium]|nr:hypothetical protein [candidate division KSB1 bacterium]
MTIESMQSFSYLVTIVGLLAVCYLLFRLIKALKKYDVKYARFAYLIVGIVPVYELIRTINLKYRWFEKEWYYSPFLYFWLIFFLFCIVQFIRESKKLRS